MHLTELNTECLPAPLLLPGQGEPALPVPELPAPAAGVPGAGPLDAAALRLAGRAAQGQLRAGRALRHLAVCWHSSRVKVCNVEDWMKSSFQRDLCREHESLVSHFLQRVCHTCPNLMSLTLSGCGHITDSDVVGVLRSCSRLRRLRLENCSRVTDALLQAAALHGRSLEEVRVDFCRNVTRSGLQALREGRPDLVLGAERSAGMIPDTRPEDRPQVRRALQKVLLFV
ncbi:hypothetical protein ACEWY4_010544 [Coilia grayii]|uniref:F-box and leucine rich repeat protein 22 n=1 Tax=Coilia grayii TaxID=363190 RepID=A0ABD1K273_9TELE